MRNTAIRATAYFALVFGVGFVLGVIRTLWLTPRWGERVAELLEAPFMLLAMYLAARFVVRRFPARPDRAWFAPGIIALLLLLAVEFTVVLNLRGIGLGEYVTGRDPVAGTVYGIMLVLFALMPRCVARGAGRRGRE